MSKRGTIILLTGVNVLLITVLVLMTYRPPEAMAAAGAGSVADPAYIVVSAEADVQHDVVYVIDTRRHRLHAFGAEWLAAPGRPVALRWYHSRDLTRDFELAREGKR